MVDIDGCLTEYPETFLRWLSESLGIRSNSLEMLKASTTPERYEALKYAYRTSGVKRELEVRPNARETMELLKKWGMRIWIATSRPQWEPVISDTKFWVKKNKLPHDKLIFANDKRQFLRSAVSAGLCLVIDDDYETVDYVSRQLGLPGIVIAKEQTFKVAHNVIMVSNWHEIRPALARVLSPETGIPAGESRAASDGPHSERS